MSHRKHVRILFVVIIPLLWLVGTLWTLAASPTPAMQANVTDGLEIAKSAWPDPVTSGQLLTYTISVYNRTDSQIDGVTITDTLPVSSSYAYAESGGELTDGQVRWSGQNLAAGEGITLTFAVTVTGFAEIDGEFVNSDYAASATDRFAPGYPVTITVLALASPTVTPTATPSSTSTPSATPTATATTPSVQPPTVTAIEPSSGPDNTAQFVTIRGSGFVATPTVFLGAVALSNVSWVNASELLALAPAGLAVGKHTVQVCNPDGGCGFLPDGYEVLDTGAVGQRIVPSQGYNDVPNDVTIYGANLKAGAQVTVGSAPLSNLTWVNSTQMRGVVPVGLAPGTYDVTVQNPGSAISHTLPAAYSALTPAGDDFFAFADDLWTSPPTIRQGDTVLLGLNVHRQGGKTTLQATVAFLQKQADGSWQELKRVLTSPIAPGPDTVEAVFVEWETTGITDTASIRAVIDPDNQIAENVEGNNAVEREIVLLPPAGDEEPPTVTALLANGGDAETTQPQVVVTLLASDTGGSTVTSMYLVEREFNPAARQWVAVQTTGWIDYQSPYTLTLTSRGGVRYIQAWVGDGAGNISEATIKTRIDYNPASDSVLAGQVRVYRRTVAAGQSLQVSVETLSGDADLYVWQPDGNRSWVSNNDGLALDEVTLLAPQSGDYQIEVFGYQTSQYRLSVVVNTQRSAGVRDVSHLSANKTPRTQPIVSPANAPEGNSALPVAPVAAMPGPVYLPLLSR